MLCQLLHIYLAKARHLTIVASGGSHPRIFLESLSLSCTKLVDLGKGMMIAKVTRKSDDQMDPSYTFCSLNYEREVTTSMLGISQFCVSGQTCH